MTNYCLIEDGSIIEGPKRLPKSWKNISGFHLLDDSRLKEEGWLPFIDNSPPEHDDDTQYLKSKKVIGVDNVTEIYTINDYSAEEMDVRILEAKNQQIQGVQQSANNNLKDWTIHNDPWWRQRNISMGLCSAEEETAIADWIATTRVESNRIEALINACTTLEQIRNVENPTWPEKA